MTKPRPRRQTVDSGIDDVSWRYLHDATTPEDKENHSWQLISLDHDEHKFGAPMRSFHPLNKIASELWAEYREQVLPWWVKNHPGTRPRCWWRFEAPEPRKRVGGRGALWSERWGTEPYLPEYGLPSADGFVTADHTAATAAGYEAADPANPPLFESQAAYLRRLGVCAPGEERRVPRDAFAPEVIEVIHPRRRGPCDRG